MFFQHIYDTTLAQGSYIIGCQAARKAMVIDPQRDIDIYLKVAKDNNLEITHIAETHIHADYLCGSRELAAVTGATMYLSDEGGPDWQYEFEHHGLKDGDIIKVGNLSFEVLHTPGHTPESISFLLTDHPASDEPVMVFTGDFVFVGDIGRPDLLEKAAGIQGTKEEGARQMYKSIQRFSKLPDHVQLWPAHGAGSACGKSLGAVASSTIGYEKIANWAFRFADDEQGFIDYLLTDQPEPPKYFAVMKHLNKVKRPLLVEVPKHPNLTEVELIQAMDKGIKVIDTREMEDFNLVHLRNTINIPGNKSFATWMGWFVNYQEQFILIAEDDKKEDLTRKLMRIGLDNILGFVHPGATIMMEGGMTSFEQIDAENFKKKIKDQEDIQIVDVRAATEYEAGHIPGADHVFLGTLLENLNKVDKDKEVIIHCQSGMRSTIAHSLLARAGFHNITNYTGGMSEWKQLGNEVVK
ncbi:MAG TPA: MBL fold metallo-hydrolase [Flavobacteriaceae bacterium]|nr:MBL fold metallo-hydrolase [Flavobacteriaceae bacterium]